MRWCFTALLLLACSGSGSSHESDTGREFVSAETSACIDDHPAAEPVDASEAAGECRAQGGSGCDGDFISLEAARCIAQNEGLEPGLEPWSIGMEYLRSYHRVAWGVDNLLEDGATRSAGESLSLDAVSGRVLGRSDWATSTQ